jgi:hypothetical protein
MEVGMQQRQQEQARLAIALIAAREGESVAQVRQEITAAIQSGLRSQEPGAKHLWQEVPCQGAEPEPEELIAWVVSLLCRETETVQQGAPRESAPSQQRREADSGTK